ncbi:cupin domain-containing protein [Egicoccus sp. AB-alg6-2]|uniref:cupin domain-containing protein n=1 Tax=Egicoccus sp. AB-alg6-2 TaxID=3242692 RepID=UPI00359CD98C
MDEITVLGSTYRFLARGRDTGGAYSLAEETFFGDPPPLHVHDREEESFFVLAGEGRAVVGDRAHTLEPGAFVRVPAGAPHTLVRSGDQPLRMLTLLAPGGFEEFFHAVAAWPGGEEALEDDALAALAARYHCRFVEE